jgi:diguanylate cyclase (GGDEF)-like protein
MGSGARVPSILPIRLPSGRALPVLAAMAIALSVALPAARIAAKTPAAPQSPEDEVRAMLKQVEAEVENDPGQALRTARRAVEAARFTEDAALLREARFEACETLAVVDARAALAEAEAGIRAAERTRDDVSISGFRSCRGYAYDLQGKPAEAAADYEAAVALAERVDARTVLADVLALRGESRHYHGRYDEAIADLNRAYALSAELGNKNSQRYALNAIANVYSDPNVGEYDKAIGYQRQILRDDEASGYKSGVATAHFNIASALEMKGDLDAALVQYRRALEMDTALGNRPAVAENERSIGSLLIKQNKAADALPWIERALAYFSGAEHAENIARTRVTRARAYHALGRQREAIEDLEFAEQHFRANNNPRQLARVYEVLADAHAASGDWRRAYEASVANRKAQQDLDRRAREEQTSRLRVQFDTARKEQENRALLIENAHRGEALRNAERVRSLQRLTILLGTALLLLLGAMAVQQVHRGRRLRALAMTDELTGLPNRRHILEFLERELRAAQGGAAMAVVSFDVDHFKRINDAHGHLGGDRVLQAIAGVVADSLPEHARVGRMGGEEFLVVLPDAGTERAGEVAETLRTAVANAQFEGFRADQRVTISLGFAVAGTGDDIEALLRRADGALYRAKREGRDRAVAG